MEDKRYNQYLFDLRQHISDKVKNITVTGPLTINNNLSMNNKYIDSDKYVVNGVQLENYDRVEGSVTTDSLADFIYLGSLNDR